MDVFLLAGVLVLGSPLPPSHPSEATKRGLGAALLRKPTKLAKMVAGIAAASDLPITVKIRTGACVRVCLCLSGCVVLCLASLLLATELLMFDVLLMPLTLLETGCSACSACISNSSSNPTCT